MSLYKKGTWQHMGLDPESHANFRSLLDDQNKLFRASALAARSFLLASPQTVSATGINPPIWPCGDAPYPREQLNLDYRLHPYLIQKLLDEDCVEPWDLSLCPTTLGIDLLEDRYWGQDPEHFILQSPTNRVYGFWLVMLKKATLDDMAALREHSAAVSFGTPFHAVSNSMKKDINESIASDGVVTYIDRKQFPVILNFERGDAWIGGGSSQCRDAVNSWLIKHCNCFLTLLESKQGHMEDWPTRALTAFHDQDLFKLEREEAYQALREKPTNENEDEDQDSQCFTEDSTHDETSSGTPSETKFFITDIACWAGDSGLTAKVLPDAILKLPSDQQVCVNAAQALDAVVVLKLEPNATILSAHLQVQVPMPDDHQLSVGVDVNADLTRCIYKNLEVTAPKECDEVLGGMLEGGYASIQTEGVARWWMKEYLLLTLAEHALLSAVCEALDLPLTDPLSPKPDPKAAPKVTSPEETVA